MIGGTEQPTSQFLPRPHLRRGILARSLPADGVAVEQGFTSQAIVALESGVLSQHIGYDHHEAFDDITWNPTGEPSAYGCGEAIPSNEHVVACVRPPSSPDPHGRTLAFRSVKPKGIT